MHDDERAVEDGDIPTGETVDNTADEDLVEVYGAGTEEEDLDEPEHEAISEAPVEHSEPQVMHAPTYVAPVFHNFMDALYPAKPPAAKNARIIRRFDLEAAKYDPRPHPTPAPAPAPAAVAPAKKEPLTREEARALRNRSLRAAAGLG